MLKIRSETENIFTSRIAFFLKVFLGRRAQETVGRSESCRIEAFQHSESASEGTRERA
jgi:hypothetical protein